MTDTNKERAAAFTQACQDLGAIAALLGFDRFPGVDSVLARVTDLIVSAPPVSAKAPAAEPVAIPADVLEAAKSMKQDYYRGPLAWAKKVIDFVADYTAPPAPTEQWASVAERLPEPGNPVLLDIGKRTPIRAMWAAKHTVEVAADDESDFGEYDEERDVYYCPEGWYEWNQNEEVHWAVAETALHWQPMPAPPQGAAKEDGNG